ncbi:unnamed protein product, partial [Closterium sp. NIES-53]
GPGSRSGRRKLDSAPSSPGASGGGRDEPYATDTNAASSTLRETSPTTDVTRLQRPTPLRQQPAGSEPHHRSSAASTAGGSAAGAGPAATAAAARVMMMAAAAAAAAVQRKPDSASIHINALLYPRNVAQVVTTTMSLLPEPRREGGAASGGDAGATNAANSTSASDLDNGANFGFTLNASATAAAPLPIMAAGAGAAAATTNTTTTTAAATAATNTNSCTVSGTSSTGTPGLSHNQVGVVVGGCGAADTNNGQQHGGGGCGGRGAVTCRVDGCGEDLSSARSYNRRHRVCGVHTRAAAVTVDGNQQRFCQQCSRFQDMDDFEPGRRSCKQSLQYHNKQRRKGDLKTLRSPQVGSGPPEEGRAKRGPRHRATGSSSDNSGDPRGAGYSLAGQASQAGQAGQAGQAVEDQRAEDDQQRRSESMQVALASADLVLSQFQNRPAAALVAATAMATPSASAAPNVVQREHLSPQPQNQGSSLQFPLQPPQHQRSMSSGSTGYASSPSFDQAERQRMGQGAHLDPHQPLQPLQGQSTLPFHLQHQSLPQLSPPPPLVQQPSQAGRMIQVLSPPQQQHTVLSVSHEWGDVQAQRHMPASATAGAARTLASARVAVNSGAEGNAVSSPSGLPAFQSTATPPAITSPPNLSMPWPPAAAATALAAPADTSEVAAASAAAASVAAAAAAPPPFSLSLPFGSSVGFESAGDRAPDMSSIPFESHISLQSPEKLHRLPPLPSLRNPPQQSSPLNPPFTPPAPPHPAPAPTPAPTPFSLPPPPFSRDQILLPIPFTLPSSPSLLPSSFSPQLLPFPHSSPLSGHYSSQQPSAHLASNPQITSAFLPAALQTAQNAAVPAETKFNHGRTQTASDTTTRSFDPAASVAAARAASAAAAGDTAAAEAPSAMPHSTPPFLPQPFSIPPLQPQTQWHVNGHQPRQEGKEDGEVHLGFGKLGFGGARAEGGMMGGGGRWGIGREGEGLEGRGTGDAMDVAGWRVSEAHESHAVRCDVSALTAAADGAAGSDGGHGRIGTTGAAEGGMQGGNGDGQNLRGGEGGGHGQGGAEEGEEGLTGELRELENLEFAPWPGSYGGFGGADLGDS